MDGDKTFLYARACVWCVAAAFAVCVALPACGSEIAVVAPATGFGQNLGRHRGRGLGQGGVSADLVDERTLIGGGGAAAAKRAPANGLAGKRLAYLVMPKDAHYAALSAFQARGGKMFAFYSDSRKIASLFGVRMQADAYRKADGSGTFSKIVFGQTAPAGSPAAIVQSSSNIFRAEAVQGRSRVIAAWHDRAGRATGEAAILASNAGWWMTHVLLADGDERAKAQFVAAVAGASIPGAWSYAAFAAKQKAAREAERSYALAQKPRAGEIRAVWEHSGFGLFPGDWPRTFRELRRYGITDIFVNVSGAGFAHYPSNVLPPSPAATSTLNAQPARGQTDQLAACLKAAVGTGIRVHAWFMCFNATRGSAATLDSYARKGWRLRNRNGQLTEYLDPSKPDLHQYLLSALDELVRRAPVHGVHLDFVRWYEGAKLPPDAARHVGRFVVQARARVKAVRPGVLFTAAVFGSYPSCVKSVGQDWESWLDAGLIDWAVPMNYSENNARYATFLSRQCHTPSHARRIVSGIGVTAIESRLGVRQVIDQVKLARQAGAAGVAFFDLDYTLVNDILPYLRLGLFK